MGISLDTISAAFHSVKISDGTDTLAIDASGNIGVTDAGGSLTVDASDLDIRDLTFATDSVDVSGSEVSLDSATLAALESITVQNGSGGAAVNIQDGGNSITVDGSVTVSATDLDIRNLVFSTDKVDVSGSSVLTTPDAYSSWQVSKTSVTNSATQLAATPLTGRLNIIVQNLGTQDIFVKNANTVSTNDLMIPKGSSQEIALADDAEIWAITSSGSADIRVAEYAA